MAVETLRFRQPTQSDTSDSYSNSIWADCPVSTIRNHDVPGVLFEDDFDSFPKTPATTEGNWSKYAQFSDTGGTITAGTGQGGEAIFGSDDDNEGASIRTLATPFKIIRTGKRFWFECRIKTSTIANTTLEFFVGLMENAALSAAVPITTTAATLADKNLVGFYRTESAGSTMNTTYKADGITAVTVGSAEVTLVASTYIKLGMRFDPDVDPFVHDTALTSTGKFNLTFYADGVKCTTVKQIPSAAGTDFPNDLGLGLVFATRNAAGSSPGTATIDWWRAAQLI